MSDVDLGAICPTCHEPWLRPTNLPGPLPLRELPAPLRAAQRLPELRRALDDRPHVQHRAVHLRALPVIDARANLSHPLPHRSSPHAILAADFGRLNEQIATVLEAGAKIIHVDVMDGHFVPPITMGPLVVEHRRADP